MDHRICAPYCAEMEVRAHGVEGIAQGLGDKSWVIENKSSSLTGEDTHNGVGPLQYSKTVMNIY